MQLHALVRTSQEVAATRSRNQKRDVLAACLWALELGEIHTGVSYLSGRLPQGRVGIGPAALRRAAETTSANTATLRARAPTNLVPVRPCRELRHA